MILEYASAIESGDLKKLLAVYPEMSDDKQRQWEKVFTPAGHIKTTLHFDKVVTTNDAAEADFRIRLTWVYKSNGERGQMSLPQHARLSRKGSGWQLVELR